MISTEKSSQGPFCSVLEKRHFGAKSDFEVWALNRVDLTSASLPPSLPRARAPGRGKRLTLPLLRIKMQYINEILLKMTQNASFLSNLFDFL